MLSLQRVLGKDVFSLIFQHVHKIMMQKLNEEYLSGIRRIAHSDCIYFISKKRNCVFWYNHRIPGSTVAPWINNGGDRVAPLPKNY